MRHEPEVVRIDRDRDRPLGGVLAYDVLVQVFLYLPRRPQLHFLVESRVLAHYGSAGARAGAADEDVVVIKPGDQRILFGRLPAAKRAERNVAFRFLRVAGTHFSSPAFSTTLSTRPYSTASAAVMKLSRSVSCPICSGVLPQQSARMAFSLSLK